MTSIPETVRIGAQTYRVLIDEPWIEDQYGGCDTRHQRIWLSDQTGPERQAQTLIHEVIEALNFELDLELEHHQITLLEHGIYQVIVDNPGFIEGVKHA